MYKRKHGHCTSEKSRGILHEDVKNWHGKHKPKKHIIKKESEDVFGNNLTFYTVSHGVATNCKEYIVAKEAFSFKRWILFMTMFSLLAFYCELYNRDVSLLGAIFLFLCFILIVKLHLKVKEALHNAPKGHQPVAINPVELTDTIESDPCQMVWEKNESLLVMASLGLQFTTTFVTGRRASQFIDQQNIQDVVLSEGIMMHRVLYYLAVLLKDANEQFGISAIVPLFQVLVQQSHLMGSRIVHQEEIWSNGTPEHPRMSRIFSLYLSGHQASQKDMKNTFPRLSCLEEIYNGVQMCLFVKS